MLKICVIALITILLSVIIKQRSPEFSMIINISGGVLILFFCFEFLSEILTYYIDLGSMINIDDGVLKIALKILSIGFLSEFMSDLAIDFGNTAIASKIIFGGKIVICLVTLPVLKELDLSLYKIVYEKEAGKNYLRIFV